MFSISGTFLRGVCMNHATYRQVDIATVEREREGGGGVLCDPRETDRWWQVFFWVSSRGGFGEIVEALWALDLEKAVNVPVIIDLDMSEMVKCLNGYECIIRVGLSQTCSLIWVVGSATSRIIR